MHIPSYFGISVTSQSRKSVWISDFSQVPEWDSHFRLLTLLLLLLTLLLNASSLPTLKMQIDDFVFLRSHFVAVDC